MIDVISFLPGKRKQTASGWISFNAPCCPHNGESIDTRGRGGLTANPDGSVSFHCLITRPNKTPLHFLITPP
jgi:hypothetical protein